MTIPTTILGIALMFRDEFMTPEIIEKYKLVKLLAKIPWYSFVITTLILIIIILLESAYKSINQRELLMSSVIDEYAYSLQLVHIIPEVDRHSDIPSEIRYQLELRNTITKPIKYEVKSLEINDISQKDPLSTGCVIPALSNTIYFTHFIEISDNELKQKHNSIMKVHIVYGPPAKAPTRKIYKKIHLESFIEQKHSTMIYQEDADEPY